MINAYLVVNKPSVAAEYLEKHNILHIVRYTSSLAAQDMNDAIIDVDKLLYIYYGEVPDDTAFKADLSILRSRLESAYFTCRSFMFILVKARPGLSDYIHAALDRFEYPEDKLEIIEHDRELMLPELSTYISGVTLGDTTNNSYIDVYVSEAGKEDKERYTNRMDETIATITPTLVDEAAMYKSRIVSLSQTYDSVVSQTEAERDLMSNTPPFSRKTMAFMDTILVAGEPFSNYTKVAVTFAEHYADIGERVLVVNLTGNSFLDLFFSPVNTPNLPDMWYRYTPEKLVTYLSAKVGDYAMILTNENNIEAVNVKIVVVPPEAFELIHRIETYSLSKLHTVYVLHKQRASFEQCINLKESIDTIIVDPTLFNDTFNIGDYRKHFVNTACVMLPQSLDQKHSFYSDCFDREEVE